MIIRTGYITDLGTIVQPDACFAGPVDVIGCCLLSRTPGDQNLAVAAHRGDPGRCRGCIIERNDDLIGLAAFSIGIYGGNHIIIGAPVGQIFVDIGI